MIRTILYVLLPESIFFSLFIIFTKNYTNIKKNVLFIALMVGGYIALKLLLPTNVYAQLIYMFYATFLMWILYKDKFHMSDLFVVSWGGIVLFLLQVIFLPVLLIFKEQMAYNICSILNRILTVLFPIIFRKRFNKIYKFFISQWNRNREHPNKVKALTVRNMCVIGLNILIFILNFGMILTSTHK